MTRSGRRVSCGCLHLSTIMHSVGNFHQYRIRRVKIFSKGWLSKRSLLATACVNVCIMSVRTYVCISSSLEIPQNLFRNVENNDVSYENLSCCDASIIPSRCVRRTSVSCGFRQHRETNRCCSRHVSPGSRSACVRAVHRRISVSSYRYPTNTLMS